MPQPTRHHIAHLILSGHIGILNTQSIIHYVYYHNYEQCKVEFSFLKHKVPLNVVRTKLQFLHGSKHNASALLLFGDTIAVDTENHMKT
jgi:hypothetical protein